MKSSNLQQPQVRFLWYRLISLDSHTLGERVTVQIGEKQEELYPKVYAARAGIPAPDIIWGDRMMIVCLTARLLFQ